MKIVVRGYTGMLGRYVYTYFNNNTNFDTIGIGRKHLDANKLYETSIRDVLNLSRGDNVINCIGILKPMIDQDGELATININTVFPQILSEHCYEVKARFIHVSSDCVYTGTAGPYNELDEPCGEDLYARTKSSSLNSSGIHKGGVVILL